MAQYVPEPTVAVEPRLWDVEVDGRPVGSVVSTGEKWAGQMRKPFRSLGIYDTKTEAVAAVINAYSKPEPERCATCGQVVA